MQKPVFPSL